jgi:flagellar protein FliO/FliZ
LPEFFSSDGPYYLQFLVIFLVILILLMGAVLLFRRMAGQKVSIAPRTTNRSRQPRLGIVDIYELDRQRQLILLRRDNVEHLLLVGGPNDVVVERNVIRSAGSRLPADAVLNPEPTSEPAPNLAPEPGPQAATASLGAPSFEMPLVVPQPKPGTSGHEPVSTGRAPPLDPALFEPEAPPTDRPVAETMKSRIGIAQVGRILRRATPSFADIRPDATPERAKAQAEPAPEPSATPPFVPPSLMSSGSPRPLDPAALSDMARQLETALRRQSSAVTPPPGASPLPAEPEEPVVAPAPPPPPAAPAAEPVIAQATARPNPSFMMGRSNPVPQTASPPPPAAAPVPKPDSVAVAVAEPPVLAATPPAASEAKAAQPGGGSPFTVEEIETEFARLLGRPLERKN